MAPLLISTVLVALAEIGDRTQLLAVVLATSFRKPFTVLGGIATGAFANHLLAAVAGYYVAAVLQASWFRVLVALSFIGMAVWTLVGANGEAAPRRDPGRGAFLAAANAMFLLEMGDKTQLATAALAARFHSIVQVTLGSTLGLVLVSVPAVFLGEGLARFISLRVLRAIGGVLYLSLGIASLVGALGRAP